MPQLQYMRLKVGAGGGAAAFQSGRFVGTILKPKTTPVISSVQTSDGRSVSYDYDTLPDDTLGANWLAMREPAYTPTVKSSYNYVQTHSAARFVIKKANDPRILNSKAAQIEYMFDPQDAVLGLIRGEKDAQTGQVIATLQGSSSARQSISNYPNGKSAYFKMATGNGLMYERKDSLNRTKFFAYQNNNTGFLTSATDSLNRTTHWTRKIRGQEMTVQAPDGGYVSFGRTSDRGLVTSKTVTGPVSRSRESPPTRVIRMARCRR